MKKILFTTGLAIIAVAGKAQIINIDKIDTSAYGTRPVWNGNILLGLEADKQKLTLLDATNRVDLALQQRKNLFIFSGSERFTYDGASSFLNKGYLHLRWRNHYKDQLHPESFVQYQWDEALGMLHRFVAGENLRYNFWHRRLWELSVATGLMYENELWNYTAVDSAKIPPNPMKQSSRELKSNNYIKLEGNVSAVSKLSLIVFYQAAFNDFFRPRISGVVNFNTSMSKHFSLDMQYNGLFDAGPVVPIVSFYYSYSTTLGYRF
ncbi:MAG: DUF481 domain-containing protein [Bacteroidota bacterium]|nr:DUF481 domain-containing protein [Bacteroidota bacterium]